MAALKKSCVLGNNLRTILISLIKKGLPLFGDLAEYAQSEERLVLNALRERGSLTRELMSIKNLQHIEEEKNSSSSKTQEKRLTPYFYLWVQLFASGEIRQIASVEKRQFGSAEIRQFESIEKSQS